MTTGKNVLVIGSSNTDMTVKLERLPRPGETILGGDFVSAAGGKGANQAVAAARAGGKVTFIGRMGRDGIGDRAVASLRHDRINVKYSVRDKAAPSGVALIFIGNNGENSIAVASGANARLMPADLVAAKAAFGRAQIVLLQLETPLETVEAAARFAGAEGVPVILNPAPAQQLPDKLLKRISILTPNETEVELLTGVKVRGRASVQRAATALIKRGVRSVIVTLGAGGALVASRGMYEFIPGFKVTAIDATAAGDVFNGALAVALAEGKTLVDAASFANAAAAISVTRRGAQPSAPHRGEIERMVRSIRSPRFPI